VSAVIAVTNDGRYTTPLGFSSLFAFCGLPLRLDSYKGCAFQCSYCYARARESIEGTPAVRPADPQALDRLFQRVFVEQREDLSVVSECLRHRMPLHFGVMGDPFQPVERRYRISLSYLRACAKYNHPLVISTRGSLIASSPYLELLRDMKDVFVRMSLSTTEDARSLEYSEVRPSGILRVMETLTKAGIRVGCRWQPYIPGVSEDPEVFAPRVANAGSEHCSFEFLRLPREKSPRLSEGFRAATGEDPLLAYKRLGASHRVREYILPPAHRFDMIVRARAAIRNAGMRFGAADNDFQHLSDSACCCSGADSVPGFENFFRHQIAHAVRSNIGRRIEYSVVAREWAPSGSIDRYLNSGRSLIAKIGGSGAVRDHIAHRWNTSGAEGSPDFFHGVVRTGMTSNDGMMIYDWDPAFMDRLRGANVYPPHRLRKP
jgi:DNA repair photolyase